MIEQIKTIIEQCNISNSIFKLISLLREKKALLPNEVESLII